VKEPNDNIIEKLPCHLFWDVNIDTLDQNKHKRFIIERAFNMGDLRDVRNVIHHYGKKLVKEELVKAGNLDKKTLNWASLYFNIPENEFKCYTKRLSTKTHWNY